jgi:hypothetical protein
MPLLEPSFSNDEPSLASLIMKAIAGDNRPKADDSMSAETEVEQLFSPARVFLDREQMNSLFATLSDAEIEAARTYTRAFLEDMPVVYEAHALTFGKTPWLETVRAALHQFKSTSHKAQITAAVVLLMRTFGTERFETITRALEQSRSRSQALCRLAKDFPEYRELFLDENRERLAALPQETRHKMFESIKPLIDT